jgi:hypothetical protein
VVYGDHDAVSGSTFQPIERAEVGPMANLVWRIQRGWERARREWKRWIPEQKVRE